MKETVQKILLTLLAVVLSLVLICGLGLVAIVELRDYDPHNVNALVAHMATAPSAAPTTQPTTAPTTEPATVPATVPEETTVPTTAPTEPPEPEYFMLTFVGDCTLGQHIEKTGAHTFTAVVGDDYAYPFSDVQQWFYSDDCTFVNLEGPLTDGGVPNTLKQFTFKGPAAYTNILTVGHVEFANVVNNHAKDYGISGYQDTLANLDAAGVYYAEQDDTALFTTESGLTIGVYASYFPTTTWGCSKIFESLRQQGAELIVVAVHWGEEYDYHPNANEKKMAHQFIDAGADIVWGHHPHVLQDIEEYNDGIIFYSLGNFSFGGNSSPSDKDTAVLQQQIVREPDGSVHLGELTIIPCYVTGILGWGNDYKPTPMEEGSEAYNRVLQKLDGSYALESLPVNRPDPNETTPTETQPLATEPAATEAPASETVPEAT